MLHGLLAHLRAWERQPDTIVLVDDGSEQPFTLEDSEKDLPVRLIRFPANRGIVQAKHHGISAAPGDIILSVDCDSRLSLNFLPRVVQLLQNVDIGLASGWTGITLGTDLFSQYSNVFGDIRKPEQSGPVDFICGAAFALRKEVWNEVDGFNGHTKQFCEDHYLGRSCAPRGTICT